MGYSGWISFGTLGALLRSQGIAILINHSFGPKVNSAMAIGNQVSGQVSTLSSAMQGAFSPAIMNAYGAGEMDKMRTLSYRACKLGTLLLLVFLLPIALELEYILKLWLKNPPQYTAGLCWCVLAMMLIDKTAIGHMIAVNASGKIAAYHVFLGGALILTLPLAYLFVKFGWGVYSVGVAMVATMAVCAWGRVWFARRLVGMSACYWLKRVFLPLAVLILMAGGVGLAVQSVMGASFFRLLLSMLSVEIVLVVSSWFFVLDKNEKGGVLEKLRKLIEKSSRRRR
jgi:Na+-driven multidrug efflux pump